MSCKIKQKIEQEETRTVIRLDNNQLRQLQLNELAILVELDRVCRKNGIEYTLAGGTMIGAVRHKGFIPWDDDVDVRFTRSEYEKFFVACKRDLDKEHFFLQEYRTDSNYRWGYSKMRLVGTEFVRVGQEHMKYRTGVAIDVFVTDSIPDRSLARRIFFIKRTIYRKILYSELGMKNERSSIMRGVYGFIYKHISRDWVFSKLNQMALRENAKDRIGGVTYTWHEKGQNYNTCLLNSYFDDYIDIEFEGMLFRVVKEYDKYLTYGYGDYMKLPPEEKRTYSVPASKIEMKKITLDELKYKYNSENKIYVI